MDLQEKVKQLPSSPGVYLMKDSLGHIIYVGKSKNLRQRVQSYFHDSAAHSSKTKRLVKSLKDFDHILTDTEFEAFLLECHLIQEIQPYYNRKMKNPLSYTYIVIRMNGRFRRIEMTNRPTGTDGELYFGPYSSKNTVERAIQGIKECFHIHCNHSVPRNSLCLNHSLGLCIGMCAGGPALEKYNQLIETWIDLLNGSDSSMLEEMNQKMQVYAESFDFEMAAKYRDAIDALNSLIQKAKVIDFAEENQNIVITERLHDDRTKLFLLKRSTILFRETYSLDLDREQLVARLKSLILTYFMENPISEPIKVSRFEIDEAQIIYSYLKSSSCRSIMIPEKWLASEDHTSLEEALTSLVDGAVLPGIIG